MANDNTMRLLAALGQTTPQQSSPPRPCAEAQIMELQDRFKRYQVRHDLQPGQIVQEKRGLGVSQPEERHRFIMIFWRMLDPIDKADDVLVEDALRSVAAQNTVDCLVGMLSNKGQILHFMAMEAQMLEPYTPPARGEIIGEVISDPPLTAAIN